MGPEQEIAVVSVCVCVCMRAHALPNKQPLLQGERNLQTAVPVTPSCLLTTTPGWEPPGTAEEEGCSMARKLDESFDFFHLSPFQVPPRSHIQHCILCSGSQQGGWLSKKGGGVRPTRLSRKAKQSRRVLRSESSTAPAVSPGLTIPATQCPYTEVPHWT